jgi:predicted ABC-type ATPase
MNDGAHPVVYLIGGPNGAGKTTAAMSIMPERVGCYEYVNADAIASALSPFRPAVVAIDAGRLMLKRIHELASKREDFAFETTMASRSFAPFLMECKNAGYTVHAVYIYLRSVELAVARVAQRVSGGGHSVPEAIVISRYTRGLANFFNIYMPIADHWMFYDNSGERPELVAEKTGDGSIRIMQSDLWNTISEAYHGVHE